MWWVLVISVEGALLSIPMQGFEDTCVKAMEEINTRKAEAICINTKTGKVLLPQ